MFTSQLPTHSPSVQVAPKLTAPRPPGRGHAPHPIRYAPRADPCADEAAAAPAGSGELLDPPIPSVENPGPEPAVITRKNPALSGAERQTLQDCERTIRQGLQAFFDVGNALMQIQDGRLYRQRHSTFQAYCHECFGLSQSHAYRHIEGAKVLQHLSPIGDKPMPANEAQTRPLVPLEPEGQLEVWRRVLEKTPPRTITAKVVELAVKEFLHAKEAGRSQPPGGAPEVSITEIDTEVLRDVEGAGTTRASAGAGSPTDSPAPTEFAPHSTGEKADLEPHGPACVAMALPAEAHVAPEPDLAASPEGGAEESGKLTEFTLADGSTAHVRLLSGRRPTTAEIRGTLAFMEKTYPNQQPPVSRPDLIESQRLVLECAAQINRLIGDRPRVELCRAVQRLGGELHELIVRPRQA